MHKPIQRIVLVAAALAVMAFACTFKPPVLPFVATPTSTHTHTPQPTSTHTPTLALPRPTGTPPPTSTSTPPPTFTPTPLFLAAENTPLPAGLAVINSQTAMEVSGLAAWQQNSLADLAWAPDGATLAVAGSQELNLYDARQRSLLRTLQTETGTTSIAYSPSGGLIAVGNQLGSEQDGFEGNIDFWRAGAWERIDVLYSPSRAVSKVAFSKQGGLLAAVLSNPTAAENNVYIWNTVTFEITRTLTTGAVLDAVFSPDGKMIATTPDRYAVKIWQIKDGALLHSLPTSFTGAVSSITFSPDGRNLATGHYDGVIRIWDVSKGAELLEMKTTGVVQSLAYSPDGSLLASGESYDNNAVRLWETLSGLLLRTLEGHQAAVEALAFSPDGTMLASGSYDGRITLWGLRP